MKLKDLARTLGLSQTTVSRALNGYPEVNAATRARVMMAAEAANYRPNIRARGLATGRAMAIGHVIPRAVKHEMVNPVFADFIAGAGETYAKRGYEMLISVCADGDEAQVYRNLKARGAVDGVILHGPKVEEPRIALLDQIGLPFAVHGRSSRHAGGYTWLDVNNEGAFARATEFLLDLGHRRIGLVNGLEVMDFAARRRAGYLRALARRGIAAEPALMSADEMTEGHGYRAARAMLEGARPTAFLVSSVICAYGVRRAVEEAGLAMGRDVSVVIHDDLLSYLQSEAEVPVFTATRSSVRAAGRRLADMLIDRIAAPGAPHVSELWEAELMVGRSTGPAPERE
jgi:LacI family transcriptional regulator